MILFCLNFRTIVNKKVLDFSNYIGNQMFRVVSPTELLEYRIVISTLIHIGKFMRKYHPDVVFIDEAAQACEPEVDCAIAMLAKKNKSMQIILAGDPHQLGPSLSSKVSEKYGLGKYYECHKIELLQLNILYFQLSMYVYLDERCRHHQMVLICYK